MTEYCHDENVRARLVEFLGGSSLDDATSVYVTSNGDGPNVWYSPKPVNQLWQVLEEGREVGRSLWDHKSLIAHLDIEYVHFDDPLEPLHNPYHAFETQQPIVEVIEEQLLNFGIAPLHLLSGRGHHFVWRVRRDLPVFHDLVELGKVPETLDARYAQPQQPANEVVDAELGAAFAGLGLVMEYLGHRIIDASPDNCSIPIELTAVEVASGDGERKAVSIDLSEYGDPLYIRSIRMPYGPYQKQLSDSWSGFDDEETGRPLLFMIPLHEMDLWQALTIMRDPLAVAHLAKTASTQIPEQEAGMGRLVQAYGRSSLAEFHDYFYSARHDLPAQWPHTYDRTPLENFPPCVEDILRYPNDWLLKPAGIQHVVRALMAVGWHPRHIAGLIRSKYERDYGWGEYWLLYDAAYRADFYTRLFAGQDMVGPEKQIAYDCQATRARGYCPARQCHQDLELYRQQLLAKRQSLRSQHTAM